MRLLLFIILCIGVIIPNIPLARPVSYPGGWTAMVMNDGSMHSLHVHYSPTAKYSLGVRSSYHLEDDFWHNTFQINHLLKRWNNQDSQGNVYLKSGVGIAYSDEDEFDGKIEPAVFSGIATDWETRRYFISYENRYIEAGDIHNAFHHNARVGVAPYIGDYGDLHTWLMLEVEHEPEAEDRFTVTPLVRLFKGVHLMEAGISNHGDILFNYIFRY